MPILKWKNAGEWISLYVDAIKNRLRRDLNLSDLIDKQKARESLELTGNNNRTHYHDDRYLLKDYSISDMGAAPINHTSQSTIYGVGSATNYGHVKATSETPSAPGVAYVGTDNGLYARGDHKHDLQTTLNGLIVNTSGTNNVADQIMRTDNNGYAKFGTINSSRMTDTVAAANYWYDSGDGYIRKKPLTNVKAEILSGLNVVNSVVVITGLLKNYEVAPLPSGFTAAQCVGFLLPYHIYDDTTPDDIRDFSCYLDENRAAVLLVEGKRSNASIGRYIVIGTK